MDSKQKIIITVSIVIVAALIVAGVMTKKKDGKMETQKSDEATEESGEIESVFSRVVPENVEQTKPVQASPAREGSSEKLGIFELEMTKSGFAPKTIAVTKDDIVQIILRAVDGDYDFAIPYAGIYYFVKKGTTPMISFEASDTGTLSFECRDHCPPSGGKGALIIAPKKSKE